MHLPDGPEIAARDAIVRATCTRSSAWIHAYDAHEVLRVRRDHG